MNQLLRVVNEGPGGSGTDPELLARFAAARDEAAFRELVRRHGPMVFRVCLRALRGEHDGEHDAEDAFQATFLVLARKAAEVRKSESVASWLYGVAHRVSTKMRTAAARRRARESASEAERPPTSDPLAELTVREAQQLLDEELARLPERVRAPLVLCCIEGLTRDEAARQLGCGLSSLKRRLERARGLLRSRLARRGLTIPAVLLASLLESVAAAPAMSPQLIDAATRAAASVAAGGVVTGVSAESVMTAAGVVRAMTLRKVKTMAVLLVATALVGVAVAAGVLAGVSPGGPGAPAHVGPPKVPSPPLAGAPTPGAPEGRWGVEFANGVTQVCEIRKDGTASAVELALPKYSGKVVKQDGPVLIEYTGDRTQRFTPVGKRMVVEHWWPGAKQGTDRPVLGIAERVLKGTPGKLRYTDSARGFRLTVPEEWAVGPASYIVGHYHTAFLCINSRGNRTLRVQDFAGRGAPPDARGSALRLESGTVYIDLAYFEPPGRPSKIADSVGSDLAPVLKEAKPTRTEDGKLSTMTLSFAKHERQWGVHAYFREPVEDGVRAQALEVLRSIEFTEPQDPRGAKGELPVGRWDVHFAKGAAGIAREVHRDGTFSLALPPVTSKGTPAPTEGGKAAVKDGAVVFTFDTGPVERWTPVGRLFVVECWPDGSKFPAAAPSAIGIAERPAKAGARPEGRPARPDAQPREEPGDEQAAAIAALKKLGGDVVTPDRVTFPRRVEVADADLIHLKALTGVTLVWFVGSKKVTDAGLEHLTGLKDLETAYLDDTGVGDAGLAHLKGLAKLKNLYLSGTKVGDPGLEQLKGMDSLRVLHLDQLKVTDAGLDHLAGLDGLVTLSLNGTKVTDTGMKKLGTLTKLAYLHLNDTGVTDDGLAHLKKLNNLRQLDLKSTKVTADGVKRLKEALPNCKIVHQK